MTKNVETTKTKGADFDAVVIGAGFGGLYSVYKLRNEQGLNVMAFDSAGDVGGTWYWNRYPGAVSDTESYVYRYSFSGELLQKGRWKNRYLTQPEILDYMNEVADHYDLRRSFQFNTKVTATHFNDETGLWHVTTDKGQTVTAKYLITGLGLLSATNVPKFKGINSFKGQVLHTGAWTEGLDLTGKRVGVIGTASTGVQIILATAPIAKHLTVFQRSAQYVVPIGNTPQDEATIASQKANYDDIWKQVKSSAVAFGFEESTIPAETASPEERERVFEAAWQRGGGFYFMFGTFCDIATSQVANDAAANFIKKKITQIVKDPETARKLMPKDIYAKRPLCAQNYYDVYNRDNVTLADVKADPIAEFTANGIRLESGAEHELDVVIFATGFDAVDGNYTRIDMRGRGGVTMRDKWKEGPLGYLGMMETDFPNFFMILGPNGPFTNLPPSIETQVEWISDTIEMMEAKGLKCIEPTKAARDEWVALCRTIADMTLFPKADSWIFGANIPGKKNAVMFYLAGLGNYRAAINAVKDGGYQTMIFDRELAAA
ncbi:MULTISPECIES: NAD(P)/FAD-dependent oxidoreductase [Rhizobium/Agrobacterium group]|jgi:cation diffusion facilitator CzcD-associated flavoprotein CzcO|uniref:flavin-containing monooxygenase n=1 Tax=Rhizobium/Agrobacterium group TaxID=227290 RepID=UPI0007149FED|nr:MULTISPECIES: NAD(P)/FAD-dependent oxidoreductase [Rhizobium/Agrobacterium group]KRA64323.1 cyclohexanone monooxygenase [Rhizobium sp. Root651]MDH1270414.1 NAD(P)/FAD-dependent oxidoreductase [Agrobacterium pusense]